MAYRKGVLMAALAGLLAANCAPSGSIHRRAWAGGSFTKATKRMLAMDYQKIPGGSIRALPKEISKKQSSALLVTALEKEAPLSVGGVKQGDLIMSVNHAPVLSAASFYRCVDGVEPGSEIIVTVWRDGKTLDIPVIAGVEIYRRFNILTLGFNFDTSLKLVPRPDFTIFGLVQVGISRRRNSLHGPEYAYLSSVKPKAEVRNDLWEVWLGIIGASRYDIIVSQTASVEDANPTGK